MAAHKIHECQRVIGVRQGMTVAAQRQPAHAAVIILHELAVGFEALLLVEREGTTAVVGQLCLVLQIVEVGGEPVGRHAVRASTRFELQ
jgi:hypothetical protein